MKEKNKSYEKNKNNKTHWKENKKNKKVQKKNQNNKKTNKKIRRSYLPSATGKFCPSFDVKRRAVMNLERSMRAPFFSQSISTFHYDTATQREDRCLYACWD